MKNILMLTTGGTIASVITPYGLIPTLNSKELLSYLPKLEENINIENEIIYGYITDEGEKFRHQWNSVKICNNLYIIDILIVIM